MNKLYYGISTLLISTITSGKANAENMNAKNLYIKADLGISQTNNVKSTDAFYQQSGEKNFNSGVASSMGIGYKSKNGVRTELSYDSLEALKYRATLASGGQSFKQDLSIQSAMVNFTYDIKKVRLKHDITPYVAMSIGSAKLKPKEAYIDNGTIRSIYKSKNTTNFTYALKAGISYKIDDQLEASLGYKYQDFGNMNNFSHAKLAGYTAFSEVYGSIGKFPLKAHSAMVGLRYTFATVFVKK